jgi:uncharacterized protein
MTDDDLSAPLGRDKARKARRRLKVALPQVAAGALSATLVIFAGWAMLKDEPFGGEPMAIVRTDTGAANSEAAGVTIQRPSTTPLNERPSRHDGITIEAAAPPPPAGRTVTIIDGTSGKRQEVLIPGTSEPRPDPPEKPEKPDRADGVDPRLIEPTRHGGVPKIAPDGSRPSDVYAHPVKAIAGKPNAPRVAIVIAGLGISTTGTSNALSKLPDTVTFAFTPYSGDVDQIVARARSEGHEILLQVPMEPFDYPDNDPGPQTLLTTLDAGQNIDRLQWLMSRFQGYVGIANYMGERFTASEQALAPIMKEAGKRGLLVVDDGSSQRSVAPQVAVGNGLTFAKADVTIDSIPAPVDIDRALGRLERIARERGFAVGISGAVPVSIERIAKWAKAAESKGILLVPISAIANRPKSS